MHIYCIQYAHCTSIHVLHFLNKTCTMVSISERYGPITIGDKWNGECVCNWWCLCVQCVGVCDWRYACVCWRCTCMCMTGSVRMCVWVIDWQCVCACAWLTQTVCIVFNWLCVCVYVHVMVLYTMSCILYIPSDAPEYDGDLDLYNNSQE